MLTNPPGQEVVDLGAHGRGNDDRSSLRAKQPLDYGLHRVIPISSGDERRRIDNERHSPKPSRNSSSSRSAIESPGPAPLRKSRKSRSPSLRGAYAEMALRMTSAWDVPSRSASHAKRSSSAPSR